MQRQKGIQTKSIPSASSQQVRRILSGLVAGILLGAILHHAPGYQQSIIDNILQPAGEIFLRLIKMTVIPLVFSCMVVSISSSNSQNNFGRIGIKTFIYFFAITTIAIVLGVIIGNVFQPGSGANMPLPHIIHVKPHQVSDNHGISTLITSIFPDNIIEAMARGYLLPVLFFSVIFGIALSGLSEHQRKPLLACLKSVSDTMFNVTSIIMSYSPIGIFGLMAITVTNIGLVSLIPLAKLIITTYLAVIFFAILILGVVAKIVNISIIKLIITIKDELILAFSTANSTTVLAQLMQKIEQLGVNRSITSLVIPAGYSFNLDGASLFLGIGTLFAIQIYNIHLPIFDQLLLIITMILTSKGAASVPGFMIFLLTATLSSAGLPLEGVAMITGVYRLMDMPITALNVLGNALAPLVIAKWEKQLPDNHHCSK